MRVRFCCLLAVLAVVVCGMQSAAHSGELGKVQRTGYRTLGGGSCDCDAGPVHSGCGTCNRCCLPIIPVVVNGIRNAIDCLLPCHSCCDQIPRPRRSWARGCDSCHSLWPCLPGGRFHHGGYPADSWSEPMESSDMLPTPPEPAAEETSTEQDARYYRMWQPPRTSQSTGSRSAVQRTTPTPAKPATTEKRADKVTALPIQSAQETQRVSYNKTMKVLDQPELQPGGGRQIPKNPLR